VIVNDLVYDSTQSLVSSEKELVWSRKRNISTGAESEERSKKRRRRGEGESCECRKAGGVCVDACSGSTCEAAGNGTWRRGGPASLVQLCLEKVVENIDRCPCLEGLVPREVLQKIISELSARKKLNDANLELLIVDDEYKNKR